MSDKDGKPKFIIGMSAICLNQDIYSIRPLKKLHLLLEFGNLHIVYLANIFNISYKRAPRNLKIAILQFRFIIQRIFYFFKRGTAIQ